MATNDTDPIEIVQKLAEVHRGIKFGHGVVGKTSHATIALIGLWTVVILRLSDNLWMDAALVTAGIIATGAYYWWVKRTQEFAEKNPGLAILEGAQLIEYQKWDAEIKGIGIIDSARVAHDPRRDLTK